MCIDLLSALFLQKLTLFLIFLYVVVLPSNRSWSSLARLWKDHGGVYRSILMPNIQNMHGICWLGALVLIYLMCLLKWALRHLPICLLINLRIIWNISDSKKNLVRYYHKCTYIFMLSTCYSCQIFIKLEFSWQISKNSSGIKFNKNLSTGSQVVLCRQTYIHIWQS